MVPRAPVPTNKNCDGNRTFCVLATVAWVWLSGCTPPGPRALLQGKKLIDQGRYPQAVAQLEKATVLLPKNALAWNYLGLAYHGSQQAEQAARAYRTALALDHKLSAVRYNLGTLYLEHNNLPAAIDELRSYTLLQPGAVEGWLKLGTALLRLRRLDEAERGFRAALELQPRHPEALNGLGLIQIQRRRWQDALSHFNLAALHDPPYAPALLNSAVVHHQYLNNHALALQRYRQYLALQPCPADWETVAATARQLEQEFNPAPVTAPPTAVRPSSAPQPPRTGPALALSNPLSRLPPSVASVSRKRCSTPSSLITSALTRTLSIRASLNSAKVRSARASLLK